MTATSAHLLPVGEPILADADLAERWGKSLHTIRVLRMKGQLPKGFRIGRSWRFYLSDVLAYEQAQMQDSQGAA